MTAPECAKCRVPHGCCSADYCYAAEEYAKEIWGVELKRTGDPKLPFMSKTGCVVPPHLRPACTAHTCEINSIGIKKGDPAWTQRYMELREMVLEEEDKFYAMQSERKDIPND